MPAPSTPYQPYAALHAQPSGPTDARPSSMKVLEDSGVKGQWKDKTILITGASSGIGIETARALYETGAQLFLAVRDLPKTEKVIEDIVSKDEIKTAPRPQTIELSLDSLDSVRGAAADFQRRSSKLNILIENAGIMAGPFGHTADGFERQLGTNHLGHFLLFQMLKPLLLKTAAESATASRVVAVSSAGHHFGSVDFEDIQYEKREYNSFQAYGQSKTAVIWTCNEIDRRYGSQKLHAVSLNPGIIATDLARHMSKEELEMLHFESDLVQSVLKSSSQGAATTVWAATSPHFENHGGVYLEDVGEAGPGAWDGQGLTVNYAPHVYDEEKEKAMWKMSCEMVGVADE